MLSGRISRVRAVSLVTLALVLAVGAASSAWAKGFHRLVLIGSDHRWVEVRGKEVVIDGWAARGVSPLNGGYVRLFFVGPGDFPANPGRYYPGLGCIALDWPSYQTSCVRVNTELGRLLRGAGSLPRFRTRPTTLARIKYFGVFPRLLKTAGALRDPVELALDRGGQSAPRRGRCYAFAGVWRGPEAALRPTRFFLCPRGVYAGGHLYPLRRGVWSWFVYNVS